MLTFSAFHWSLFSWNLIFNVFRVPWWSDSLMNWVPTCVGKQAQMGTQTFKGRRFFLTRFRYYRIKSLFCGIWDLHMLIIAPLKGELVLLHATASFLFCFFSILRTHSCGFLLPLKDPVRLFLLLPAGLQLPPCFARIGRRRRTERIWTGARL